MPDPTILSRDPFQRARADAEAKYGRWRPLIPALSAGLALSLVLLTAARHLGVGGDPVRSLEVLFVAMGVAILTAYLSERRLLRKKARLIDQRWRMLSAEAARLREAHNTSWQGLVLQKRG